MTGFQLVALVVTLTAGLAYINARFLRLPPQIGLLVLALAVSLGIVALDAAGVVDAWRVHALISRVDFGPTVMHGLLGLLLFAGALHLDVRELAAQRAPVLVLSVLGTILSTLCVGGAMYAVLGALGRDVDLLDAMLFGALISPTDPIAVLGALKTADVPRALAVQISGESLFNDGVGVVLFVVLLEIGAGSHVTAADALLLFAREALGGAAYGFALGTVGNRLLRGTPDYAVEVLVTLGLAVGGYAAGELLGVSAPIGAVVAGIVVGNRPRSSDADPARPLERFWELVDEVLNAVLFLLLGLEATRLRVSATLAVAAAAAVAIVLAARAASVAASLAAVRIVARRAPEPHALAILTWSGLRGGLSVALALSLEPGAQRDPLLVMTYAVVAFAILVQGLTLPVLLRRLGPAAGHG